MNYPNFSQWTLVFLRINFRVLKIQNTLIVLCTDWKIRDSSDMGKQKWASLTQNWAPSTPQLGGGSPEAPALHETFRGVSCSSLTEGLFYLQAKVSFMLQLCEKIPLTHCTKPTNPSIPGNTAQLPATGSSLNLHVPMTTESFVELPRVPALEEKE